MEQSTSGFSFNQMPEVLRLKIIGTTVKHILCHELKSIGFITQDAVDEHFKLYTSVSFTDACDTIESNPQKFLEDHFSDVFKVCYPHGLARLSLVNKPMKTFGAFEIAEVAADDDAKPV